MRSPILDVTPLIGSTRICNTSMWQEQLSQQKGYTESSSLCRAGNDAAAMHGHFNTERPSSRHTPSTPFRSAQPNAGMQPQTNDSFLTFWRSQHWKSECRKWLPIVCFWHATSRRTAGNQLLTILSVQDACMTSATPDPCSTWQSTCSGTNLGWQEVDGDQLVLEVRPLLCHALGRPDITLADLCQRGSTRHACNGGGHHSG